MAFSDSVMDVYSMFGEALGDAVDFAVAGEFAGLQGGDEGLLHGWGGVVVFCALGGAAVEFANGFLFFFVGEELEIGKDAGTEAGVPGDYFGVVFVGGG